MSRDAKQKFFFYLALSSFENFVKSSSETSAIFLQKQATRNWVETVFLGHPGHLVHLFFISSLVKIW